LCVSDALRHERTYDLFIPTVCKPYFSFHTDDRSIHADGNGDYGLLLDTSRDSATATHAREHNPETKTQRGGTYNKRSRTMTQLAENDPSREELLGAYVSHDPAPFPWQFSITADIAGTLTTYVKVVEDKAHDPNRKG
jgi:hypothetical protein